MSGAPVDVPWERCVNCGGATVVAGSLCPTCVTLSVAPVVLFTCPTCPGIIQVKGKACPTCVADAVKIVGEAAAILDESPEEIAQREAAAHPYPGCIDPRLQADTTEALEAKFDADLVELAKLIEEPEEESFYPCPKCGDPAAGGDEMCLSCYMVASRDAISSGKRAADQDWAGPYPPCTCPDKGLGGIGAKLCPSCAAIKANTVEATEAKFDADLAKLARAMLDADLGPKIEKAIEAIAAIGKAFAAAVESVKEIAPRLEAAAESFTKLILARLRKDPGCSRTRLLGMVAIPDELDAAGKVLDGLLLSGAVDLRDQGEYAGYFLVKAKAEKDGAS